MVELTKELAGQTEHLPEPAETPFLQGMHFFGELSRPVTLKYSISALIYSVTPSTEYLV